MKTFYSYFILLTSLFVLTACPSSSDDEEDTKYNSGDLTGIWLHYSRSLKYDYDYIFEFKNGKVFEQELWEYTDRNNFLRSYNSLSNWQNYTFANGILRVGSFSSAITFSGKSFTYIDGDGKEQTFYRWDGTIEQFMDKVFGATETNYPDPQSSKADTQTFTVKGVSFRMINVDGGTFQMGSDDSDAYVDEKPVHSVTLSSFSIGETEVTQALWYAVMGQKPTSDGSQWSSTYGLGDNRPAYFVSWNDCQDFITKLNQLTGKQFRLPTEAEWEYAARGGNKSNGYKYAGSNTIENVAWYGENSPQTTHDVGTKQANELGIYDMTGNVSEWCSDWYGSYSSTAQTNPTGSTTGSLRVNRGGDWNYVAWYCRVSRRSSFAPGYRFNVLGLRLAL